MAPYTPGPWRISSRPAQLVSTDGQVIALAIGYDSENLVENACLIAAAPDLLEAARAMVAWSNGDIGVSTAEDLAYHVLKLQIAITKAEVWNSQWGTEPKGVSRPSRGADGLQSQPLETQAAVGVDVPTRREDVAGAGPAASREAH